MTRKKPPGVPSASWVEKQIEEARKEGAFDDLPGEGKPLADLSKTYDPAWWVKKLVKREGVSMLPPALAVRRKVERAMDRIWGLPDEDTVRQHVADLNLEIAAVNSSVTSGPATNVGRVDADAVVERWRARRDASGDVDAKA